MEGNKYQGARITGGRPWTLAIRRLPCLKPSNSFLLELEQNPNLLLWFTKPCATWPLLTSPLPTGSSYCELLSDVKHIPASGPFHLQFPLPGRFFFQIFTWLVPCHSGLKANVSSWEACPTYPGTLTRVAFPVPIHLLRIQEGNLLHVKFGLKHILVWSFNWNVLF